MVKFNTASFLPALTEIAIANKACLNPKNNLGELALCGGLVLNIDYHEAVTVETIQLSGLIRNKLSLQIGDQIDCE